MTRMMVPITQAPTDNVEAYNFYLRGRQLFHAFTRSFLILAKEMFAKAGTVESVSLIEDRETGRSRGFGFVEMSTKEEGAAAIQQFNGVDLGGCALNVNEAKPREDRGGGGGGRNGGSRY